MVQAPEDLRTEQASPAGPFAHRSSRSTTKRWVAAGATILLLLLPAFMGEFGTLVLATGAITVTAALGLHILTHWAGQISLGHVAFVALGAFATADLAAKAALPFWLAILAGALITIVGTVVIGLPALRIRGFYIAIVTLSFGLAADRWLFRQERLSGGSSGVRVPKATLPGITFASSRSTYYIVMLAMIAMIVLARKIGRTKAGRAFLAIRADEDVAAAWGINVAAYKLLAFAVAGGFAAVAGGLQAYSLGIVGPQTFPVTMSIQFVAIVVIGGPGVIWGSVGAAALFGMLPSLQSGLGKFSTVTGAVGILMVITRYPGGLNELARHPADRFRALSRGRRSDTGTPRC